MIAFGPAHAIRTTCTTGNPVAFRNRNLGKTSRPRATHRPWKESCPRLESKLAVPHTTFHNRGGVRSTNRDHFPHSGNALELIGVWLRDFQHRRRGSAGRSGEARGGRCIANRDRSLALDDRAAYVSGNNDSQIALALQRWGRRLLSKVKQDDGHGTPLSQRCKSERSALNGVVVAASPGLPERAQEMFRECAIYTKECLIVAILSRPASVGC